ncbi:hypothetical protein SLS62_000403 [Diatrype stigma]|uniref:Uncharacterized protein n=1 Tax=Diatrype stigma TaxID=117547 RepID=A0AAN9V0Q7_9PEZI
MEGMRSFLNRMAGVTLDPPPDWTKFETIRYEARQRDGATTTTMYRQDKQSEANMVAFMKESMSPVPEVRDDGSGTGSQLEDDPDHDDRAVDFRLASIERDSLSGGLRISPDHWHELNATPTTSDPSSSSSSAAPISFHEMHLRTFGLFDEGQDDDGVYHGYFRGPSFSLIWNTTTTKRPSPPPSPPPSRPPTAEASNANRNRRAASPAMTESTHTLTFSHPPGSPPGYTSRRNSPPRYVSEDENWVEAAFAADQEEEKGKGKATGKGKGKKKKKKKKKSKGKKKAEEEEGAEKHPDDHHHQSQSQSSTPLPYRRTRALCLVESRYDPATLWQAIYDLRSSLGSQAAPLVAAALVERETARCEVRVTEARLAAVEAVLLRRRYQHQARRRRWQQQRERWRRQREAEQRSGDWVRVWGEEKGGSGSEGEGEGEGGEESGEDEHYEEAEEEEEGAPEQGVGEEEEEVLEDRDWRRALDWIGLAADLDVVRTMAETLHLRTERIVEALGRTRLSGSGAGFGLDNLLLLERQFHDISLNCVTTGHLAEVKNEAVTIFIPTTA